MLNEQVLAGLALAGQQTALGLVEGARVTLAEARETARRLASEWSIFKPLVDTSLALARLLSNDEQRRVQLLTEARNAAQSMSGGESERLLDLAVCDFLLGADAEGVVAKLDASVRASSNRSTAINALLTAATVFARWKLHSSSHSCLLAAAKLDERSARPLLYLAALYTQAGCFALAQRA